VTKAKPTGRARHFTDHALCHRLVQDVQQPLTREPADPRQRIQPELTTHHGGGDKHAPAVLGEPSDALADHGAHARRDPPVWVRVGQAPFGVPQTHDLHHEERIPLRFGVNCLDQPGRELRSGGELDVGGHVGFAQPRKLYLRGVPLTRELGQRRGQRLLQHRVDVAKRAEHEQPAVADLASDELEQEQRWLIRGVQVVEHQHERPRLRGRSQK
jgi:hypothetical protein